MLCNGAQLQDCIHRIEVARSISKVLDVAGTGEGTGKGRAPKVRIICRSLLGHWPNRSVTVIKLLMGRYHDHRSGQGRRSEQESKPARRSRLSLCKDC